MRLNIRQEFFEHRCYKELLVHNIEEFQSFTGYRSRLAEAAGCQRSFLSQVLKGHANLSEDHAAGIAQFWELEPEPTDFFLDLVRLSRAGTERLKAIILRRLEDTAKRHRRVAQKFKDAEVLSEEQRARFYLQWWVSAVYMSVQLEGIRTANDISEKLNMPIGKVDQAIALLQEMDLVEINDAGFTRKHNNLFIANSPFLTAYANVWRQKAVLRLHDHDQERELFYTTLYAVSREDREKIREMLLEFIDKAKERAHREDQPEEELFCLCIDFFDL